MAIALQIYLVFILKSYAAEKGFFRKLIFFTKKSRLLVTKAMQYTTIASANNKQNAIISNDDAVLGVV